MIVEDVVLLVDDDPVCQNIVRVAVDSLDYRFAGLLSGERFMETVRQLNPTIILIDVHLPGCSGFDLCTRLKEDEDTCRIPVLFLTMVTDPDSIDEAFERGAIDYITKPFRLAELKSRIQAQVRLGHANRSLEQELTIKRKLFSLISHDLRSPFSSMIGVLKLLVSDYEDMDNATRLEFLGSLLDNSEHQLQLLDNLMYWSRGQSERIAARLQPVSPASLVQSVFQALSVQADGKRISLVAKLDKEPDVLTDPDLAQAILRNLVHNAIKFSPEDRAVVVRRNPEEPVLASGRLFLLIEDFGVGFANPEQLEGRGNLDSTPGTKGEHGAGIGLAVCRGLAGRIDARLELVRSDARGSVVSLSLPLASL